MDQDKFIPRDVTTIKPKDVRVGDYFIFRNRKFTVVTVDSAMFFYRFVGTADINRNHYAQVIATHNGKKHRMNAIVL